MPPKMLGSASGSSIRRTTCGRLEAHPAAGVDHVRVHLPHAHVGVGEDRRDREQHQRERHVREPDAEVGDEERDQRQARHRAADVRDADREQLALAGVAERQPDRDRDRACDADRGAAHLQVLPGELEHLGQAADLHAAGLRLARVEDEVERVREVRQEAEREVDRSCRAAPSATASAARWTASSTTSSASASSTASPPAATTPVLNVMLLPVTICSPSPPAPANTASVASPTVVVVAIRRPAMMSGSGERQLHPPQQLAIGEPHPAPGVPRVGRDVVEAGDDVAEDDLQRVGGERDQRGGRAAAGDRQQQEEHRQARQRVEHAGDADDRADQPPLPARQQRQRERDHEAACDRRSTVRYDVLDERVRVAVEVVDDPARAELVLRDAAVAAALADLDLRQHRSAPVGRGAARVGRRAPIALGEFRKWEMISTDSTPATRPCSSTTGPYWVSDWSRSESASRST